MKRNVIIADRAVNSIRRIISTIKQVSLIGGEDTRLAILKRIQRLGNNAEWQSRKAKFEKLDGDYRSVLIWNYRIYYKIDGKRVVVLDVILDQNAKPKS